MKRLRDVGRSAVDRDVGRLALQSAASAIITFQLMTLVGMGEIFVGILSAVMIIRPSIGSTLTQALDRIAATVVGSVIGVASLVLLPEDYETLVALTISMVVLNVIAGVRPAWRYGFVAAIALSLSPDGDVIGAAMERLSAIGVGGVVGTLVSVAVWPNRAETRAMRQWRTALEACRDAIDLEITDAGRDETDDSAHQRLHRRFEANNTSAREAATVIRGRDETPYLDVIAATDRLWASLDILRRVAFDGNALEDGRPEFEESVERFKPLSRDAIDHLLGGDVDGTAQTIDELWAIIEDARTVVRRHDSDSDTLHMRRTALVFGMEQIVRSLESLAQSRHEVEAQPRGVMVDIRAPG